MSQIRQDTAAIDVGWLYFYMDANTCINEAQRFTAIATI